MVLGDTAGVTCAAISSLDAVGVSGSLAKGVSDLSPAASRWFPLVLGDTAGATCARISSLDAVGVSGNLARDISDLSPAASRWFPMVLGDSRCNMCPDFFPGCCWCKW